MPARLEEPALATALACGALSLMTGWRCHPYRRAAWTWLETALGAAALFAAGVTLGAEADRPRLRLTLRVNTINPGPVRAALVAAGLDVEWPHPEDASRGGPPPR